MLRQEFLLLGSRIWLCSLLLVVAIGSGGACKPEVSKLCKQLTYGDAPDQCPSWSPDGRKIAFHSQRTGNGDIWVVDAEGDTPKQLTTSSSDETHPAWSPDGKRIAFIRCTGSAREGRGNIVVMNADGTDQKQITDDGTMKFGVKWHPNGKRLFFGELTGSPLNFTEAIWEIDVTTKERRKVLDGYSGGLSLSPGGTSVVFDCFESKTNKRNLYILDLASGKVKSLVADMFRAWFPAWSPEGK